MEQCYHNPCDNMSYVTDERLEFLQLATESIVRVSKKIAVSKCSIHHSQWHWTVHHFCWLFHVAMWCHKKGVCNIFCGDFLLNLWHHFNRSSVLKYSKLVIAKTNQVYISKNNCHAQIQKPCCIIIYCYKQRQSKWTCNFTFHTSYRETQFLFMEFRGFMDTCSSLLAGKKHSANVAMAIDTH